MARAINAASGNRPLVVLANLTGFDGSPESMRKWQLEYGAEIGRAITNFRGPIVFVVVSRYHGGAFVVFSKRLNDNMGIAAVAGSYASVIGGAPAAGVVLVREVGARTEKDPRVTKLREQLAAASGDAVAQVTQELADTTKSVRAEKLKEIADEFDAIHDIKRAMRVGSVDEIISAADLRPFIIGSLERRLASASPPAGRGAVRLTRAPAHRGRRRGPYARGWSIHWCEGRASSSGEAVSSAAGAGPSLRAQTVKRNGPLRRHQPGKTGPSTVRTSSGDQVNSGGRRSATVTSTERVSRRRPVRSTLSALSFADQNRLAAMSRASPAASTNRASGSVR